MAATGFSAEQYIGKDAQNDQWAKWARVSATKVRSIESHKTELELLEEDSVSISLCGSGVNKHGAPSSINLKKEGDVNQFFGIVNLIGEEAENRNCSHGLFMLKVSKDSSTQETVIAERFILWNGSDGARVWRSSDGGQNASISNYNGPFNEKPATLVTKGSIVGQLFDKAPWSNEPDTILNENENWDIILEKTETSGTTTEIGKRRAVKGSEHFYDPFTLDKVEYLGNKGGLPEGTYKISYRHKGVRPGCSSADVTGVCDVLYEGSTTFKLFKKDSTGLGRYEITSGDYSKQKTGDLPDFYSGSTWGSPDSRTKGIHIYIKESTYSGFEKAIQDAVKTILGWMKGLFEKVGGWIESILFEGNDINNKELQGAWQKVRDLSLGLLTLGLLIIAFANVLQIDIEKYGLNRMIPKLVIGIVMTYFSFVIARFILEIASAFQVRLLSSENLSMSNIGGVNTIIDASLADVTRAWSTILLLLLLLVILAIAMIYLAAVLVIRIIVIWFLVAVAPLAFMMQVMPFTENLYGQWWAKWWKWVFMGPAIAFMLWLTTVFLAGYAGSIADKQSWIFLLMAAAGIFIAAGIPMSMGGEVYSGIKGAWGSARGVGKFGDRLTGRRISTAWGMRKGTKESAMKLKLQQSQAKMAQRGFWGRFAAGTNKKQAAMLEDSLVSATSKEMGMENMSEADLAGNLNNRNIYAARAAARELAGRKRLGAALDGMKDPNARRAAASRLRNMMGKDGALDYKVRADNKDAWAAMANNGVTDSGSMKEALKGATGVPLKDIKGHQLKLIRSRGQTNPEFYRMITGQLADAESRAGFMRNADDNVKAAVGQLLAEANLGADVTSAIRDPRDRAAAATDLATLNAKFENFRSTTGNTEGKQEGPLD